MYRRSSRYVGLMMCCLAASAALALPAAAPADDNSITYQGEVDTAGPLVMDTTNGNDPQTYDLTNLGSADILMIQRMPVTKTITAITLGDLSVPSTCAGNPTVALQVVYEGTTGFDGTTWTNASDHPTLSSTPSRITWHLAAPLTLLAGKAYVFRISWAASNGCTTIRQTTWAHNASKVEAVPDNGLHTNTCQTGVPLGSGHAVSGQMRQWHDLGGNEPSFPCISGGGAPLDSSYPRGWLVSWSTNGSLRGVGPIIASPTSTACQSTYPTYMQPINAQTNFWRVDPNSPTRDDILCTWPAFYDYGYQSRYGWWYATPFRTEKPGQPRAMYVKLETIDYDALVRNYRPYLQLDSMERWYPMGVYGFTSIAGSSCDDSNDGVNALWGNGLRLWSAGTLCGGDTSFTLDNLPPEGQPYSVRPDWNASAADYLDERGSNSDDYAADSNSLYYSSGQGDHVYGRAYQDPSGKLWLEYWFYYYYNDQGNLLGVDLHEGDWENILLRMKQVAPGDYIPIEATYEQHGAPERCPWSGLQEANGRPIVFVANGSHASYFSVGRPDWANPALHESPDINDGGGPLIDPTADVITSYTPNWMRWPGSWGSSGNPAGTASPVGPAFHTGDFWSPQAQEDNASQHYCDGQAVASRKYRLGGPPAPRIRVRGSASSVTVRYRVPRNEHARSLLVTVSSTSHVGPPTSVSRRLNQRNLRGNVRLGYPPVAGPYVVRAVYETRRRRSRVASIKIS